jgi:anti-sigma regulatory factor (Ser/Thr protein kinase)
MNNQALSVELPLGPDSPGWARQALAEFRGYVSEEAFIDLQLVVSELVADAVLGASEASEIKLRIEIQEGRIHVLVREGAQAYKHRSRRPELGEAGWGMYLTRILARRWGTHHEGERGCVWVQMPLAAA